MLRSLPFVSVSYTIKESFLKEFNPTLHIDQLI